MDSRMTRSLCVAAAALASFAMAGAGTAAGSPAARAGVGHLDSGRSAARAVPGSQLWAARYNGTGNDEDQAEAVAASPDGATVFVTGASTGTSATGVDYATVAYNATTSSRLWVARYDSGHGPGSNVDDAHSLAVSPTGKLVFITGGSSGDYATVGYNAATGKRLWVKRYNGPANSADEAASVTVSPTGKTVFVTGYSDGTRSSGDYATVAYNAATGAQLWVKRYNGPGNSFDAAVSVAVSPTGGQVYVTGHSTGRTSGNDYTTVAYNATTGAWLWGKRYNGPGNGADQATSVAVSPTGKTVFVTGYSPGRTLGTDYATVAYGAATGAQLWVTRYNGPGNGSDQAASVAVGPTGGRVYVTGSSTGRTSGTDYATVAYSATTGKRLWAARYNGPGNFNDTASAIAVSPTSSQVYVTGYSTADNGDYATIAYRG